MKCYPRIFLGVVSALLIGSIQPTVAAENVSEYQVTERGPHHRVMQRVEYEIGPKGERIPHIHSYTELATGMHYKDAKGEWTESKDEIDILPNGAGAAATKGQHKVIFPPDIYDGLIELNTPDGKWLRSRVVGLSLFDAATGESVLIAETKSSIGELHGSNVVVYPNAFTDFKADVRYTYRRDGFEQDIVLREQPPSPSDYGLNDDTTKLQVLTEFVDAPAPGKRAIVGRGFGDETLDFGVMKIGQGRAFVLGDEKGIWKGERVGKSWEKLEQRDFLIEEVDYQNIEPKLRDLPPASAAVTPRINSVPGSTNSEMHQASSQRQLPPPRSVRANTNSIQMAKADVASRPGYVIDYVTLNSSQTNYTFKGDTTYYISGQVDLYGTTTIEGGTVVKYTPSAYSHVYVTSTLDCKTANYRPAVFTSRDDNSAGEPISGSTGSPTLNTQGNYQLVVDMDGADIHDMRFSYGYCSLTLEYNNVTLSDLQFIRDDYPIYTFNSGNKSLTVRNVLMQYVGWIGFELGNSTARIEHLTANQCNNLWYNDYSSTITFTNCLFVAVTNLGTFTGSYNATNSTGSGVFQPVGGGHHYLTTNSIYRNAGTTNISAAMLAALKRKTTYPPVVYSNAAISDVTVLVPQAQRDTQYADLPDLGYHYDPLDYAFGGTDANTNLTFAAGTAVGWWHTTSGFYHASHGIHIGDRQTVTFDGTQESPTYWVRCNTVQEQGGNAAWQGGYGTGGMTSWADQDGSYTNAATVCGRFLRCSGMASYDNHFRDDWGILIGRFRDCEFYTGALGAYVSSYYFTNCLFYRSGSGISAGRSGNEFVARNCTWYQGSLNLTPSIPVPIYVRDNSFDGTAITTSSYGANATYANYDYNAYTNASNPFPFGSYGQSSVTYNWQTGPLGDFYLPTNSVLVDAGSTTADQVGLYHFTSQTNQVKETDSTVDVGYHYVAVNTNGTPIDTDGDIFPDYWEDFNGNGLFDHEFETSWYFSGPVRGVDSNVRALAKNADGDILVGGYFITAGSTRALNVAYWLPDTLSWSALYQAPSPPWTGNGVYSGVRALAIDSNERVYAGGTITSAGSDAASNIASWDSGTLDWSKMEWGVRFQSQPGFDQQSWVNSMISVSNTLYVVGRFRYAGSIGATNIAAWTSSTNSTWSFVGPPPPVGTPNVIATDGVHFYVGGTTNVVRGNLSGGVFSWTIMDSNLVGEIDAIAITPSGRIFIGGQFHGVNPYPTYYISLAEWNAVTNAFVMVSGWSAGGLVGGAGGVGGGGAITGPVKALCVDSDKLTVGGTFLLEYPKPTPTNWANNIAAFDLNTSAWSALGGAWPENGVQGEVDALVMGDSTKLYVGGTFQSTGDGQCAWYVASWDSANNMWSALIDNPAPTAEITSPGNGTSYSTPANVTIVANAEDDCTVTKVEFFRDSTLLGTDTTPPYSYIWNLSTPGTYSITVKATDNDGEVTTSDPISVTGN